ncbi:hypothetical protein PV327_009306 [Microctonus hyperodae]|uniref:Uncharacterized protein n=1 Tax=Microctonus hyperodae TaxID=165561 RepID=A0AA39FTZ7_MICHY|nr:hypothetical protein PV327_009306 [Microctonus hyperodae]
MCTCRKKKIYYTIGCGGGGGGGDAASSTTMGRGAMRGRRIINSDSLLTRPQHMKNSKSGTFGRKVRMQANYFKILSAPDWCLFQYRVDFSEEEDRMPVRKALLRLHKDVLGTYLFDGTVLYTCARLPNVTEDQKLELASKRESDQKMIIISIRLVGDLVKGDPHYLQLYNIIMRRGLEHLNLQLVGRNYFDAKARVVIPEFQFELWPGYLTTIRQHECGVLMGVEVTHKVMRQQTIISILNEIRRSQPRDLAAECKREVIGMTVLTAYNNNTYRVDDIDFSVNPQTTFKKKGEEISYMDYYQQRYGIRIQNPTQPLLLSRSTVRDRRAGKDEMVYLIPELCRATGLTDSMKTDFNLMKAMANHTRITPRTRIEKLMAFNERLIREPNVVREFTQWDLNLARQLVDVPARILDSETIMFARRGVPAGDKADWTPQLRNSPLLVTAKLKDWFCVVPDRVAAEAQDFIKGLIRAAGGMEFQIEKPNFVQLRNDSAASYAQQLEEIMSRNNPQLVFCVSMRPRADVYSAIKKICCVDRPVPSQVFLSKNFRSKGVMSIATKVAIQLNCKIGGAPWACQLHKDVGEVMVVGFDVCHDPNQKGTDIGAMVASLNRGLSRYFSAVSRHTTNEELSNDFGVNMVKAVRKYHELNRRFPERIIIYRDGVGDGQIPFVVEHEVKTIRKALAEFYGSPEQVRMTFVLVTKRINTRFFLNGNNPPPGTIVDDVVTNPNRYDFFIVAQHVGQGSVSPTAYNVIDDNSDIGVDVLQQTTFKLTHMYFNWSGTVRVPAPCQYAHKLAFLVSQSIHRKPSTHLDTLLYFL